MDNILPFMLETLSQKPKSEETEKKLLKELREKCKQENLKINNFTKGFQQAIEIGEDLGIIRLVGDNIRLPFSLENKKKQPTVSKASRSKSAPERTSKKSKLAETTDKVHRSSRRRRSSNTRRQGRSRSRSRSNARGRSQRRRRSSRR